MSGIIRFLKTFPHEKVRTRLQQELARSRAPQPNDELQLLLQAARGNSGQSQICRYLLFLLVGSPEPTDFSGEGLREMRMLDRKLSDAFLKVLDWWREGESDQPLYDVLAEVEKQFPKRG